MQSFIVGRGIAEQSAGRDTVCNLAYMTLYILQLMDALNSLLEPLKLTQYCRV